MTRILSIDPGPTRSAWLVLDHGMPQSWAMSDNAELLARLRSGAYSGTVVIERIRSYGMPVGAEVLETAEWCGAFREAAHRTPFAWLTRMEVKLHLCHAPTAGDPHIRQALIDRYGGKAAAIGTVANPGPLHGITGDGWSALAVAVTQHDREAA